MQAGNLYPTPHLMSLSLEAFQISESGSEVGVTDHWLETSKPCSLVVSLNTNLEPWDSPTPPASHFCMFSHITTYTLIPTLVCSPSNLGFPLIPLLSKTFYLLFFSMKLSFQVNHLPWIPGPLIHCFHCLSSLVRDA